MATVEYIDPAPKPGHSLRSSVVLLDSFRNPSRIAELGRMLGVPYPVAALLLADKKLDREPLANVAGAFGGPVGELPPEHPLAAWEETLAVVERVAALPREQAVGVYGDYDADGVTSVILVRHALLAMGFRNVTVDFSHLNEEGFGFSEAGLDRFLSAGCSPVFVLDTGTNSVATLRRAAASGLDVVVIDHHPLTAGNDLVDGVSYLNPHVHAEQTPRPEELRNAGLSWYFARELSRATGTGSEFLFGPGLALAALGTLADAGSPAEGPHNRWLLTRGLSAGVLDGLPAVRELFGIGAGAFGLDLGEEKVVVGLRKASLGKRTKRFSPRVAFDALAPDSSPAERGAALAELGRQYEEFEALARAGTAWLLEHSGKDPVTVVAVPTSVVPAHFTGLSGTLASRLTYQTGRPAIVFVRDDDGSLKGSWRMASTGIDGEAMLGLVDRDYPGLAGQHGGHAVAGGVRLDAAAGLPLLRMAVQDAWDELGGKPGARRTYDSKPVSEVTQTFATAVWDPRKHGSDILQVLSYLPFSRYGTRRPSYLLHDAEVTEVGREGKSQWVRLAIDESSFRCTLPAARDLPRIGQSVDAVLTPAWSEPDGYYLRAEFLLPSEYRVGSFGE